MRGRTDRQALVEIAEKLAALQFDIGWALELCEAPDEYSERLRHFAKQVRDIATEAYQQAVPRDDDGGQS